MNERDRPTLYTVGHGAREIEEFLDLLRGAGIRLLVDVRTAPGSRKHPQYGQGALASSLESAGIQYAWRKELGGWRKARPDSPHRALRSPGFRGYADHMDSPEFRQGLAWLIQAGGRQPSAVMCAESLWWRCHRRMISDALVADGCRVLHLMEGGRLEPHRLSQAARVADGRLVYDVQT